MKSLIPAFLTLMLTSIPSFGYTTEQINNDLFQTLKAEQENMGVEIRMEVVEPYKKYNEDFQHLLNRTHKIEIFDWEGDTGKRKPLWIRGKKVGTITNQQIISLLKNDIEFDLDHSGSHSLCSEDYVFIFSDENREFAELGLIKGHRFRWARGPWTGEGQITARSILVLTELMLFLGAENPIQYNLPRSFTEVTVSP